MYQMNIVGRIESSILYHETISSEGELAYRILFAEQHFCDNEEALLDEIKNLFSLFFKGSNKLTRSFVNRYAKYLKKIYDCKTYFDVLKEKVESEVQEYGKKVLPAGYEIKKRYDSEKTIIYVDPSISNAKDIILDDNSNSVNDEHLSMFKTLFCDAVIVPNSYFSFAKGWQDAEPAYILESDWIDLKDKLPDVANEFVNRGDISYLRALKKIESKRKKIMKNFERNLKKIPKNEQERIEMIELGTIKIV